MWITHTHTYLVYIIAAMLSSEGTAGGNKGGAFSPFAPSCSPWWWVSVCTELGFEHPARLLSSEFTCAIRDCLGRTKALSTVFSKRI